MKDTAHNRVICGGLHILHGNHGEGAPCGGEEKRGEERKAAGHTSK